MGFRVVLEEEIVERNNSGGIQAYRNTLSIKRVKQDITA
jgi:hypothetical protein